MMHIPLKWWQISRGFVVKIFILLKNVTYKTIHMGPVLGRALGADSQEHI